MGLEGGGGATDAEDLIHLGCHDEPRYRLNKSLRHASSSITALALADSWLCV